MHIPGHLAVALIQHALPPFHHKNNSLLPLLGGALAPDVIDKTIGYGLRLMPNGRHVAHNLFALAVSSGAMWLLLGRGWASAWLAGYSGHLLADFNSTLPWFFPLKKYAFRQRTFDFNWRRFWQELILLLAALLFYGGCRQK